MGGCIKKGTSGIIYPSPSSWLKKICDIKRKKRSVRVHSSGLAEHGIVYGQPSALFADILNLIKHGAAYMARIIYGFIAELAGKWCALGPWVAEVAAAAGKPVACRTVICLYVFSHGYINSSAI